MIISVSLLLLRVTSALWCCIIYNPQYRSPPSQPCQFLNGNFDSGDISHLDPATMFLRLTHFPPCEHTEVQTAHPPYHRPSSSEQPFAIQRKWTRLNFYFWKTFSSPSNQICVAQIDLKKISLDMSYKAIFFDKYPWVNFTFIIVGIWSEVPSSHVDIFPVYFFYLRFND